MRHFGLRYAAGALALFAFLAVSGASHASCTGSDRLASTAANCLDEDVVNTCTEKFLGLCVSYSAFVAAEQECEPGSDENMVVKIDKAGGTDTNLDDEQHGHEIEVRQFRLQGQGRVLLQ